MTVRMVAPAAEAALAAIVALVDTSGPGKLAIYAGTRPALADDITTQTLLAEWTLQNPAFNAPVSVPGVGSAAHVRSLPAQDALATGTASFYRIYNGAGDAVWDGTVTLASGNGDLVVTTLSVVEGVVVSVVSLILSVNNLG